MFSHDVAHMYPDSDIHNIERNSTISFYLTYERHKIPVFNINEGMPQIKKNYMSEK